MTLLMIAALAASSAPATVQTAPAAARSQQAEHAGHAQAGTKPQGKDCCCKAMADGKMACCAEHGKGHDGKHSDDAANR